MANDTSFHIVVDISYWPFVSLLKENRVVENFPDVTSWTGVHSILQYVCSMWTSLRDQGWDQLR